MALLSILLYFLTKLKRTRWYLITLCYSGVIASAMLNEYMTMRTGGHNAPYYAGMIPIMIVGVALLPMGALASLFLGVIVYLIYVLPILLLDTIRDVSIFILYNLYLISVLIITSIIRIVGNKNVENELRLQCDLTNEKNLLDRLVQERTAELNKSEQWHRSIFENANDGILILTKNGIIANANDMASKMFNSTRNILTGMHVGNLFKSEMKDDMTSIFNKMLRVRSIVFEMPYNIESGKTVFLEISIQNILIGEDQYILMVTRNITEKRMFQEQLSQSQKMESIATFAGGIAHDVRNIITSMIAYIEIVRNDKGVSERTLHRTNLLDKSILNAGNMISQLLTFARKSKTPLAEAGLNDVVRDTLNIIAASIGEKIEIIPHLWRNDLIIRGNINQIETVIMNLVLNARDAMPHGGRITIATEALTIAYKENVIPKNITDGEYAVLTISDTGIGITTDNKQRIFEPFFTTKEQGKGTGLGLAMVYSIVADHKGHITVESEPGKGSEFKIYFPLISERTPREKSAESLQEATIEMAPGQDRLIPQKTGNILFVDDDEALITMMSDALEARGYNVVSTTRPEEAVRIIQRDAGSITLLITDMAMPKMNGADLVRQVRAVLPEIKVIVISAFNHEKVEQMLNGINVSERLHKPFAPSEFVAVVRTVLDSDLKIGGRESTVVI